MLKDGTTETIDCYKEIETFVVDFINNEVDEATPRNPSLNKTWEDEDTIYKCEVMHDLKALFDNAGDYFEDEYELVKQYIEQLEQALDKACEELEIFDMTFNDGDFIDVKNKEQWKEWTLQSRK